MPITETGDAWNLSNPAKPTAEMDPNDIIDVRYGIDQMESVIGFQHDSHTVICGPELEKVSSVYVAGVIVVRYKQATGQTLVPGTKYPSTLRIVFTNGESRDKTVYFKIKER